jgi:hypothetical protein
MKKHAHQVDRGARGTSRSMRRIVYVCHFQDEERLSERIQRDGPCERR